MAPQREWFEKDYYDVLGVPSTATEKDITRAYRKLAKQFHPDANPGDAEAEERFKEVSAANDVLSDPEKRKEYDQVREMVASGRRPGRPGGSGAGSRAASVPAARRSTSTTSAASATSSATCSGGRCRGGGRGRRGRGRAPAGPTRGADLEAELHLDFLDAVHGITTSVHFTAEAVCHVCHGSGAKPGTSPDICPTCGGTGDVLVDQGPFSFSQVCPQCGGRGQIVKDKCRNCKGRGVEVRPREVKVKIPAGVQDGQRIKVAGRGAAGHNGGPPGDLFVVVHVSNHPIFGRSGKANLTVNVPVTFAEAALGAQVKVPTLDAPVTLKVKPGTQSGTTQKVKGRGIHPAKGNAGDLLVTFEVDVPADSTTSRRPRSRRSPRPCPTTPAPIWECEARWSKVSERSTSSRWRPSSRACTRRRCASTSARGSSSPPRTQGRSRRYSDRDIALLRRIQELTNEGVSLVGVRKIIDLEDDLARAQARIRELEHALDRAQEELVEAVNEAHRQHRRDLVPVSRAVVRARRA